MNGLNNIKENLTVACKSDNSVAPLLKTEIYDAAIVGAGPAGLSAALTLKAHNKSIVWFGNIRFPG